MVDSIQPTALAIVVTFPVVSTIFVALRVGFRSWTRQFKWGTYHHCSSIIESGREANTCLRRRFVCPGMGAGRRECRCHIRLHCGKTHRFPHLGRSPSQHRGSGVFFEAQHGSAAFIHSYPMPGKSVDTSLLPEARRPEEGDSIFSESAVHLQLWSDVRCLRQCSDPMSSHTYVLGSPTDRQER
jgi:hypothetical protein